MWQKTDVMIYFKSYLGYADYVMAQLLFVQNTEGSVQNESDAKCIPPVHLYGIMM